MLKILLTATAFGVATFGPTIHSPRVEAVSVVETRTFAPSDVYEGKVAAITKGSIAILSVQGENRTFLLSPESKITINGKPASWEDIGVGQAAKIVAVADAAGMLAKQVEIRSVE